QLGVEVVNTAGSVAAALASIDKDPPAMAILDYNLGSESSDPVADKLRELGIPFYLATGYGEMADRLEEHGALGLLKKPYGKAEIAEALGGIG
ncbi:MAG: HWE histidine kinase domain-containing protein, partial [Tsuneonella sp.]